MDQLTLVKYYFLKRLFLFLDEWLFYIMLYKLYSDKYYKPFVIILLYGLGCLLTSYKNISKIEKHIINIDQELYIISWEKIKTLCWP